MSNSNDLQGRNAQLAEEIIREAHSCPTSRYAGKYVGIADGNVVALGDDLREVLALLRQAVPDREEGLVIEASADYHGPHEIWSI